MEQVESDRSGILASRRAVKSRVRAALLVIVPAIFVAILAPRGGLVQGIAAIVLLLAAGYLATVLLLAGRTRRR